MPSDKHNLITVNAMDLIFFYCLTLLQPEVPFAIRTTVRAMHSSGTYPVSSFVFHSSLLTIKSIDLVAARDGFLCITKIVHSFHGDYLDYRGTFQTALDSYCCVTS